jgi:hypothetical protein
MPELDDEKYVRELFEELYSVKLRKVPESRVQGVKTFDYELLDDAGARVAAVEIKCLERAPRTPENGWYVDPNGFTTRNKDNIPSRVGNAIHEKCKQLCSFEGPKVLVFVNDEHGDALDFDDAFNGYLVYGNDQFRYTNTASAKIAQGRINEEKWTIDLYIWINRYEGRHLSRPSGLLPHEERGPFFRLTSELGHELARKYFGAAEIPKPVQAELPPTLGEALLREALKPR